MSELSFLPWLRRGIATSIERVDGDGSTGPRAIFPIDLRIDTGLAVRPAGITLGLHGPGEVVGLDAAVVVRTWPQRDADDAESNYFPLVELAEPDLPWRYTPASANAADRLRPWIVLLALREDEIETWTPARRSALPAVRVTGPDALPDLAQSWAWAHVQVTGDRDVSPAELESYLSGSNRVLARILSPRRLEPRTRYHACLVPAFERGRLAGLGQVVDDDVDALTPSWTPTEARPLPVYHTWRFSTGDAGDFESLVRLLETRPVPPTLGLRPLDASQPGSGLGPAATEPLMLDGALLAPGASPPPWPPAERDAFVAELATLLDAATVLLASPGAPRAVAPPIYGSEHARRWDVETAPGSLPRWLHALNLQPPRRVGAALGTAVVQAQQRALMAAAWKDAGRIRELNQKLRQAQLAREVLDRVWVRHVATASADALLAITTPLHARVMASPFTVRALIEDSRATRLLEVPLRRIVRPRGPVARRAGRAVDVPSRLIGRVGRGELVGAGILVDPAQLITTARVGADLPPPSEQRERDRRLERWLRRLAWLLIVLAVLAVAVSLLLGPAMLGLAVALAGLGWWVNGQANALARANRAADATTAFRKGSIGGLPVSRGQAPDAFVPAEGTLADHQPRPASVSDAARERARAAFSQAATSLVGDLARPIPVELPRPELDLARVVDRLRVALEPRAAVVASVLPRLRIADRVRRWPGDPLEPIMAAPEFPQPMYEPLRDLSQDWLLPGLDQVPPNTVSLLETNQAFIEAYMVGLSHEMARELRWNEFPTDLRGTYFRQFWDVRGYVGDQPAERLKDLTPIHGWDRSTDLGAHTARLPPPGGKHLVLLVRGDLLRRYPNTIVYAVQTVLEDGRRAIGATEKHPVFRGTLDPDVTFFGFDLTAEEVRGSEEPSQPQGWYFVLQEQPGEPRFGMDVADETSFGARFTSWNELAWSHLAPSAAGLATIRYVDLEQALPDTTSVVDPISTRWHAAGGSRASDLAYATLQRPMRLAVHGSDMLEGIPT
jgi:hypothetical protein